MPSHRANIERVRRVRIREKERERNASTYPDLFMTGILHHKGAESRASSQRNSRLTSFRSPVRRCSHSPNIVSTSQLQSSRWLMRSVILHLCLQLCLVLFSLNFLLLASLSLSLSFISSTLILSIQPPPPLSLSHSLTHLNLSIYLHSIYTDFLLFLSLSPRVITLSGAS